MKDRGIRIESLVIREWIEVSSQNSAWSRSCYYSFIVMNLIGIGSVLNILSFFPKNTNDVSTLTRVNFELSN